MTSLHSGHSELQLQSIVFCCSDVVTAVLSVQEMTCYSSVYSHPYMQCIDQL